MRRLSRATVPNPVADAVTKLEMERQRETESAVKRLAQVTPATVAPKIESPTLHPPIILAQAPPSQKPAMPASPPVPPLPPDAGIYDQFMHWLNRAGRSYQEDVIRRLSEPTTPPQSPPAIAQPKQPAAPARRNPRQPSRQRRPSPLRPYRRRRPPRTAEEG